MPPTVSQPHVIEISIDPNGKITGEVTGVEGPSCETLTAWLDSLGDVIEHKHTKDFDKKAVIRTTINR